MEHESQKNIESVVETFIQEMEQSDLSRHLISIYRELGIEP
jgi:hypothetical protein